MIRNIKMVENEKKRPDRKEMEESYSEQVYRESEDGEIQDEQMGADFRKEIIRERKRERERDRRRWSKAIRREVINLKWSVRVVKS